MRSMTINAIDAINGRRSIRQFTARVPSRDEVETILAAAVQAPNHRLTQPWRFFVLGAAARYAYGLALGNRKAKKIEDADAAERMRRTVAEEHAALPLMIAVAMTEDANLEIREEDFAATMMGVQNLSIAAVSLGLGTHMKTGAIMQDPAARSAAGVPDGVRIVMVLNVGEPAAVPPAKERRTAASSTIWMP